MAIKSPAVESNREHLTDLFVRSDGVIDLAEAALRLAAYDSSTDIDLSFYRAHLDSLYDALGIEAAACELDDLNTSPKKMASVLRTVLHLNFRYRGDGETYDDLDNANLMRVIDRRLGLPVTIGILYISAARSLGWNACGLNFPGHFLVRLESLDGNRGIIDPFHGGIILDTPALRDLLKVVTGPAEELDAKHYQPVSDRDILVRLQNNIKTRRLDLGQMDEALKTLKSMQVLLPDSAALCREAGLLQLRLGHLSEALRALEDYMKKAPPGPERNRIDTVVKDLKQRIQ